MTTDSRAAPGAEGITREAVAQYFAGASRGQASHLERWRHVIALARLVAGISGVVLIALSIWSVWHHAGTVLKWPLPVLVPRTPILLGALLAAVAAPAVLWRWGWELPALAMAGVAALDWALLKVGDPRVMLALAAAAGAAVLAGLVLRLTLLKEKPIGPAELEPRVDAWTEATVERLVAGSALPAGAPGPDGWRHIVRTFPQAQRGGAVPVLCRMGRDGRPRVSPLGVTAFAFRPDTLVVVEAAIDLTREALLYRRVQEIRHADIVSLAWSSETVEASEAVKAVAERKPAAGAAVALARGPSKPEPARQRDALEIRLAGGGAVSLVFRDTGLMPPARAPAAPERELIEAMGRIEALWRDVVGRGKAT